MKQRHHHQAVSLIIGIRNIFLVRAGLLIALLLFIGGSFLNAQEKNSWFHQGKTVYTPSRNFGFFGYSGPATSSPQTSTVPPPGKREIFIQQKNATVSESNDLPYAPTDTTGLSATASPQTPPMTVPPPIMTESLSVPVSGNSVNSVAIPTGSAVPAGLNSGEVGLLPPYYSSAGPTDRQTANNRQTNFMLFPRPVRSSLFQGFELDMSYAANSGDLRAGFYEVNASATLGFPVPTYESPLQVTPFFSWRQYNMPKVTQSFLPEDINLYSPGIRAEYIVPVNDVLLFDLAASVMVGSDFKKSSSSSVRFCGRASLLWKLDNQTKIILGAVYTDISQYPVLPIAGILWHPSENCNVELMFPNPRIAWKCPTQYCNGQEDPWWFYIGGELSGNRWIIEGETLPELSRRNNTYEMTSYDCRVLFGLERKSPDELNWAIEGGLLFARSLELEGKDFTNYKEKFTPKPTGFARLKIRY